MKVLIYKIILGFVLLIFLNAVNVKNSLENSVDTSSLKFYLMALKATEHGMNSRAPKPKDSKPKATGKNSTSKKNATSAKKNTTGVKKSTNSTNVVGKIKPGMIIEKAPYEVKSCDQVLFYQGNTFKNPNDYTSRKSAFFTMSAYMINHFEKKDSNKLEMSVNLNHIKEFPTVYMGSKNCIGFKDSYSKQELSLCTKKDEDVPRILHAFTSYMKCRMGDNLLEPDPVLVNRVLAASCKWINKPFGKKFDMPVVKKILSKEMKTSGLLVKENMMPGFATFDLKEKDKQGPARITDLKKYVVPGSPVII